MYINTHTYYSLRYGVFPPEILLKMASLNKISSFVLTDINTTSACIEFVKKAKKYAIKPIIGVDFRNGVQQQFILLAISNIGFENINKYLTEILHNKLIIPDIAPELDHVAVIYPLKKGLLRTLKKSDYLGVAPEDLPYIRLNKINVKKAVVLKTVSFQSKKDFNTHRLLRAIDNNTLLSKLPLSEQASPLHTMVPKEELITIYAEYAFLIENTIQLIDTCSIAFDCSENNNSQNQRTYTKSKEEDIALLYHLCEKGLAYRYPVMNEEIHQRN